MTLIFEDYLKVKDKFYYTYDGNYKEFIWQLLHVRKFALKQFPSIEIFIACNPKMKIEFSNENILDIKEIKNNDFIKPPQEIKFNLVENPILKIVKECKIKIDSQKIIPQGNKCFLITEAKRPFKSLENNDLNNVKNHLVSSYEFTTLENADILFAVECEELYKWAYQGKPTVLLSNGENEETYKNIFPNREILNIKHI